jgi:hypothetical protein
MVISVSLMMWLPSWAVRQILSLAKGLFGDYPSPDDGTFSGGL